MFSLAGSEMSTARRTRQFTAALWYQHRRTAPSFRKGETVGKDDNHILRHVIVRGRVQGVGFRAFVEHHAIQRNIEGWVRNRRDGTVEAVFAGTLKSVEGMIAACQIGPLSAKVDALDQRVADEAELTSRGGEPFSCLPTV